MLKSTEYSCRQCDKSGTQVSIKQAAVPATPIPKSYASASLLAYIIISKYQYSLPLYRLENLFKQMGVELSRQTTRKHMKPDVAAYMKYYNNERLRSDNSDEMPMRKRLLSSRPKR